MSLAMTALPSFVQLMATLGLDNHSSEPISESRSPSHSRSSSNSSTESSVPQFSNLSTTHEAHRTQSIPPFRDLGRPGSMRSRRYSPYSFGGTDSRRESLPSLVGSIGEGDSTSRSTSPASPRLSRRGIPAQLKNLPSYSDDLPPSLLDHKADTPISSYARRRTPQTSPISPVFPRPSRSNPGLRNQSIPSTIPISLPTIPTIQRHSPSLSDGGSDRASTRSSPFETPMTLSDITEVECHTYRSTHTGLRLSAPHRVDNRCDIPPV